MADSVAPTHTTCPYCGVGCGLTVSTTAFQSLKMKGDEEHPANLGRLCSKGSNLIHTLSSDGRLLQPQIDGVVVPWEQAIHRVATEFSQIIAEHGPDAVALYVSGQLLTEDYYVANKLMKGFVGSANIDTNSRLCMSSAVVAHKRAFGEDSVPACYEDLEQAKLMVLMGSNTAWCHPVLFQRIKAAKRESGMKVVVIDPRRTATCEIADLHLALKPGTDVKLFNGLLSYLAAHQGLDAEYIEHFCQDFEPTLAAAQEDAPDPAAVADACQLEASDVAQFYQWFLETEQTVTCFSQGSNQSSQGSDKGNAIINCHLATGRIGKPGASPFSLTGQPNAMGGREVGGLANQLAGHMDFAPADVEKVQNFWRSPQIATKPGLKAVDLFREIEAGSVKAVWIMGTNPVVSLPDADQVQRALRKAQLVVVSDCIAATDTTAFAHVLLPAQGWGEKDGTVTNSERRISRQRRMVPPEGEARQDWEIIAQVAQAMGFGDYFSYQSSADVFREHAALSELNRDTNKQFDIAELATISDQEYDNFTPFQWPLQQGSGSARLYSDGKFSTESGKANFIPVTNRAPTNPVSTDWPLCLNTGRVRDHWHTMTRTALAPRLNAHKTETYVEINPTTAAEHNIYEGELVQVESRWGAMIAKANLTDAVDPKSVFVPMHWNDQWSRSGRVGALVNPAVDPFSGQPEAKYTPCKIAPWQPKWSALLISHSDLPLPDVKYAVKVRGDQFFRYELADQTDFPEPEPFVAALSLPTLDQAPMTYADSAGTNFRAAWFDGDRLVAVLFVQAGTSPQANADRGWLADMIVQEQPDPKQCRALLTTHSHAGFEDCGKIICACFGVGENTIRKAITENNLKNAADVGKAVRAGTNCGSCISEINEILEV